MLILGAGVHGRVVKELAESLHVFEKIDFLDDDSTIEDQIGQCSNSEQLSGAYSFAFPSFVSNNLRMKWIDILEEYCYTVPVLIHPTASISPSASIYPGSIIGANATIGANSIVEKGCIIGLGVIIDYNSFIGFGCHISSGTIIQSHCVVKSYTTTDIGSVYTRLDMPSAEEFLGVRGFS